MRTENSENIPSTRANPAPQGHRPLVSVIIAAYQQPDFLNAAVETVRQQTYGPIETIVVDDASGPEFVSQYRLPPDVRLIVQDQRRALAAATRNAGLQVARGKYIALLDQDDLWVPEKTAWQVELMEADSDVAMTYSHFQLTDADRTAAAKQHSHRPLGDDPLAKFIHGNKVASPSQVMFQRSVLDRIGAFDETIRGASDWDMWLRCCMTGRVVSDPRPMTLYRQHEAQWSRNRVMIHEAEVKVLQKAASWLLPARPDLRGAYRQSLSRALRRVAMARLAAGAGRREAARGLLQAIRVRPFDMRNCVAAIDLLRGVATDA